MEAITIIPKNKEEESLLKKILVKMNIDFISSRNKIDNPSPSGDKWFLNGKNLEEVNKGIADSQEGRKREVSLDEIKKMLQI